jgi:hypothetical protein
LVQATISGGTQARSEQIEVCAAIHLPLNHFEFGDVAFGLSVGPRLDDPSSDGLLIGNDPPGEGREQACGSVFDPFLHGVRCFGSDHQLKAVEEITSCDECRDRFLNHGHHHGIRSRDLVVRDSHEPGD